MNKLKITFDSNYISEILISECMKLKLFKEALLDGLEIGFVEEYDEDHNFTGMTVCWEHPDKDSERLSGKK